MEWGIIISAKRKLGLGIELRTRNPNFIERDMGNNKQQAGLEEAHYFFPFEHTQLCVCPVVVCDPAKIFLTSKFSYLLFCNPAHKKQNWGTANRWGDY